MKQLLTRMPLLLASLAICLTLTACVTIGPKAERETIWAKHGTVGKVVSNSTVDVLVMVDGEWKRTVANIKGMVVIDEPTYHAMLVAYREKSDK